MRAEAAQQVLVGFVAGGRGRAGGAGREVGVQPGRVGRGERAVEALRRERPGAVVVAAAGQLAHERPSPRRAGVRRRLGLRDGLALGGQRLAEALAGPGEERPRGDVRDAQRGGQLEAGHVVELREEQGGSLALGDPLQGPLELARQAGVHHEVLGGRRRVAGLPDQRDEAHDPLAAEVVERDAVGDLVQPRAGVLGLLEGVVGLVGLHERVLGEVRGELRVTQHAHEVGVDLVLVLGEQLLDEFDRPGPGPRRHSPHALRAGPSLFELERVRDHAISWAQDRLIRAPLTDAPARV